VFLAREAQRVHAAGFTGVLHELAPLVKQFFLNEVKTYRMYVDLRSGSTKKDVKQSEKLQRDVAITSQLVTLFYTAPDLFLHCRSDNDLDEKKQLFTGLCELILAVPAASACLTRLHRLQHIARWSPRPLKSSSSPIATTTTATGSESATSGGGSGGGGGGSSSSSGSGGEDVVDVLTAFWELSAIVNQSLGQILIHSDLTKDQHFTCVRITERILRKRNAFLEAHFKEGDSPSKQTFCRSLAVLETGLLVTLPHPNPELVSLCVTALHHLTRMVELTRETLSDFSVNLDVYRSLCRDTLTLTGPAAQQKAIAKALREVRNSTSATSAAWDEIYERWRRYTSHILYASWSATGQTKLPAQVRLPPTADPTLANSDKSNDDITREWYNYSSFLIALSSVAINKEVKDKDKDKDKDKSKGKKSVTSAAATLMQQQMNLAHQFVYDLLELFMNEYDQPTRETITQLVGQYIPRDVRCVFSVCLVCVCVCVCCLVCLMCLLVCLVCVFSEYGVRCDIS
jgi:hypothetical protein